jgi:hypothetical protein
MSLDSLINVNVQTLTTAVSRAGFGTPMIVGYHNEYADRVREYAASTALTSLVTDGFATDHPIYLAAQAILSQNPRPSKIKVGRKTVAPTKTIRLTPVITTEGFVYRFTVEGTEIEYTVLASATVASICTALVALVDALATAAATSNTTHFTVTAATAGNPLSVVSTHLHTELQVADLTTDTGGTGLAADLALIQLADPDWYGFVLASQSEAEILLAAAWCETQRKIFVCSTQDSAAKSSGSTTDVMYDLNAAGYARTLCMFHENAYQFASAAMLGNRLPDDPGSDTWAFKTLAGITFSPLQPGEVSAIQAKKGVVYVRFGGVSVTLDGWSSSGEFMDITRFVDWDVARRQERLFALLVNRKKIPYTDKGIALVVTEMEAQNQAGIDVGGITDDPAPTATAPAASAVSAQDRALRVLPDVNVTYQLAGAIHAIDPVSITVNV